MIEIKRSTRHARQMNLTPMVDVVFQLLIFFMLTTSFVRIESMEMSFPSVQDAAAMPDAVLRIFVGADNSYFLNNTPIERDALSRQLRDAFAAKPEQSVLLISGDGVTVQRLVGVMDDIYLLGGKNVSVINSDKTQEPEKRVIEIPDTHLQEKSGKKAGAGL